MGDVDQPGQLGPLPPLPALWVKHIAPDDYLYLDPFIHHAMSKEDLLTFRTRCPGLYYCLSTFVISPRVNAGKVEWFLFPFIGNMLLILYFAIIVAGFRHLVSMDAL